jgi:ATP-dependent protease HslVU (ClpYQ) peptidase subunit
MQEGTIAGTNALDTATIVVMRNNTVVGIAEEGYISMGDETTVDMNVTEAYIDNLQPGDVVRVAVLSNGAEAFDAEVAGGDLRIYGG